ncbi:MAG: hypothetical protein GF330_13010 [Candidatus Eisenbacteria bacterium]|nr:hypothetical protein [Candidatus Eisenbacteria bacterium]
MAVSTRQLDRSASRAAGRGRLLWTGLFAVAFGYLEAAVVVYLRALYYPDGFALPLRALPAEMLRIELGRELATLVMLAAVAVLSGRRLGERFGYFLFLFGLWDIVYYIGLWITLDWPASLLDWDILFLLPLPWLGPVIAPLLIAANMVGIGIAILWLYRQGGRLRLPALSWLLGIAATAILLYSFMRDTGATLHQRAPEPYAYGWLAAGLALYGIAYAIARLASRREAP